jgi:hypothetical protein
LGKGEYQSNGFNRDKEGSIKSKPTMLASKNVGGIEIPIKLEKRIIFDRKYRIFTYLDERENFIVSELGGRVTKLADPDENGFIRCTTSLSKKNSKVLQTDELIEWFLHSKEGSNMPKKIYDLEVNECMLRRYIAYVNVNDPDSIQYIVCYYKRLS